MMSMKEALPKKKPRVPALVEEDPAAATCAILVNEYIEEQEIHVC